MIRDATPQGFAEIPQNRIFLRQGTTFCTPTPSVVSTVLGSCVAVSLWDIDLHVGGLNHYVLPHRMQELLSARFGDVAIDQLLYGMARLGCRVASLRAKIYGGAEVLPFGASGDTDVRDAVSIHGDAAVADMQHDCHLVAIGEREIEQLGAGAWSSAATRLPTKARIRLTADASEADAGWTDTNRP
jgi:chemotaxis receptor (MCP) glutamine deamidase CheD